MAFVHLRYLPWLVNNLNMASLPRFLSCEQGNSTYQNSAILATNSFVCDIVYRFTRFIFIECISIIKWWHYPNKNNAMYWFWIALCAHLSELSKLQWNAYTKVCTVVTLLSRRNGCKDLVMCEVSHGILWSHLQSALVCLLGWLG